MILPCDVCGKDCRMKDDVSDTDAWVCRACRDEGYDADDGDRVRELNFDRSQRDGGGDSYWGERFDRNM